MPGIRKTEVTPAFYSKLIFAHEHQLEIFNNGLCQDSLTENYWPPWNNVVKRVILENPLHLHIDWSLHLWHTLKIQYYMFNSPRVIFSGSGHATKAVSSQKYAWREDESYSLLFLNVVPALKFIPTTSIYSAVKIIMMLVEQIIPCQ